MLTISSHEQNDESASWNSQDLVALAEILEPSPFTFPDETNEEDTNGEQGAEFNLEPGGTPPTTKTPQMAVTHFLETCCLSEGEEAPNVSSCTQWRKYGQNKITRDGEPVYRFYFSCKHDGCPVRRKVPSA